MIFHATFILGGLNEREARLDELIREYENKLGDREEQTIEVFGIDDARSLFQKASYKNTKEGSSIFIIRCQRITLPAQNALLKLLEEPPQDTLFVFLMPPDALLLETLLSRVEVMRIGRTNAAEAKAARDFLKLSRAERLAFLQKKEDDLEAVRTFLESLEGFVTSKLVDEKGRRDFHDGGKALETALLYINDPSASRKLLLEHVALMLPEQA